MNLSDALSDWPGGQQNQSGSGGWPGQPPSNPVWPHGPSQPSQPAFPGPQPSGPGAWPQMPSQPSQPAFPGPQPSGPSFPVAPQLNLKVPFTQTLNGGLMDKKLITICGTVHPNPNMLTIDVCAGNDLALHFNPRFNEAGKKVIVRNSRFGNKWGKEEREAPNFPFAPGQHFELKILVTNSCFKVAVNNSHLFEYKHRMQNLRNISHIGIFNDVTLSKFTVE